MRFFATAAKGTEPALRDELRELRLRRVRADRGGVHFEGDMADAARACLWSRVAVRVLLELSQFEAAGEDALYEGVRAVDWTRWLTPRTSLAVRASCRSSRLTHSQYIAQKTKDAIVDQLRERLGTRPSVDRDDPDAMVTLHLANDRATLYLDASGASLHERGWRARTGPAPLRETLAAAVVRLSGWTPGMPLVDPMCGAGTLAIEAACWALGKAPGLSRSRFGFERWASHDAGMTARLRELRQAAKAAALPTEGLAIRASDIDPNAVDCARVNAKAAGVVLAVECLDVSALRAERDAGFLVTNPPYGERLASDRAAYQGLAAARRRMAGYTFGLLAGSPVIADAMGQTADRWWALLNGPIPCRLLVYDGAR